MKSTPTKNILALIIILCLMFWSAMHKSIASLEPPKVPKRPSIDQLQNDYKAVKKENIVKVKNFIDFKVRKSSFSFFFFFCINSNGSIFSFGLAK